MDKPEFLVELGPAATNEAFAIGMAKLLEREGRTIAAAELRRLHAENERLQTRYEACDKASRQWLDKTAWIQETGRGCELGMHRADAVRQRLSAVEAKRDALLEALKTYGWHTEDCPQYPTYVQPKNWPACTCGFDDAIKAVGEGK